MKIPKVSVVLTTYNRAHILGATIDSILSQTLQDFELIICDDASKDGTEQVCREYEKQDRRVRYLRGAKNVGMPGNLNAGIKACAADYVANLHDGDFYDSSLLEKWAAALDSSPRAAFVFNAYRQINSEGRTIGIDRLPLEPCVPGSLLLEQVFFRRWQMDSPVWGTVMARRSAYFSAGLFDPRFGFIADVDMWLKLAERFDVAYIPEPLIALPSRDAVPRIWNGAERLTVRQIEQMFWESRMRHYRKSPIRRLAEAVRHWSFVAASRAYRLACIVNSRTIRLKLRRPEKTAEAGGA